MDERSDHVHRHRIAAGRLPRDRGVRPRPGPRQRHRRAVGERRHHAEHGGHRGQERRLGDRAHQPGDHPAGRRRPRSDRAWRSPPRRPTIPSSRSSPRSSTASSGRSRASFTSRHDDAGRRSRARQDRSPTTLAAAVTLRVAEARVEDIGHAIARLAPADLVAHRRSTRRRPEDHRRHGGRRARRAVATDGHEGVIQIDGTAAQQLRRGTAGAGVGRAGRITPRPSPSASRRCGRAPRRRSSRPNACSRICRACRSSPAARSACRRLPRR